MPLNELGAPSYLRVKYATSIAAHNLSLFFAQPPIFNILTGKWGLLDDSAVNYPYEDIVANVFNRINTLHGGNAVGVTEIQLWEAVQNAPNEFVAYIAPPSISAPVGGQVASAYVMWVFSTPSRKKMRLTSFEYTSASPQRFPPNSPPTLDDGSIEWFVLRGGIPFAHQDGERVSTAFSKNQGYNRKLARKYGRSIAP